MQKILRFEFHTATKDRSKSYQLVTMVLFSLAVAIVVVSALINATASSNGAAQQFPLPKHTSFTGFTSAPPVSLVGHKK